MPSAAIAGWWFGFGYFLAGLYWIGHAFLVDAKTFGWLLPFAVIGLPACWRSSPRFGLALARLIWTRGADARPGARARAHRRRMAARPSVQRLSLERLRLRADRAAGAGAERRADRALGPDLHRGRGLREPGGARRRPRRHAAAAGCRSRSALALLAALAGFGALRLDAHADRPSSTACGCASCSPICSRTRNSTTRQAAGDEPLSRAVRPRHRAAIDRRARRRPI